ncbi:hypothetical protein NMY22_g17078 [Coprinellus aureogranulatus]|nr:hypothetical protein NMY22_g17078 [Coprinellus aureogranulatus]
MQNGRYSPMPRNAIHRFPPLSPFPPLFLRLLPLFPLLSLLSLLLLLTLLLPFLSQSSPIHSRQHNEQTHYKPIRYREPALNDFQSSLSRTLRYHLSEVAQPLPDAGWSSYCVTTCAPGIFWCGEALCVAATTMGVLSLLTTGWWGAFSDRHGRTTILCISIFGSLITDFTIMVVYYFSQSLPGNYWFVMVGVVLEGLFGGFSTALAANHAYIAETTTEATRARYLSTSLGLMFTGVAFGPTIGSLLIQATGTLISVFYLTLTVHVFYAIIIFIILPEPLSRERMKASQRRYASDELREGDSQEENSLGGVDGGGGFVWKLKKAKRLFRFLSPLGIFMPSFSVEDGGSGNPLKRRREEKRDWSLALIAVAYGFTTSTPSSTPFVFQYATAVFVWGLLNAETHFFGIGMQLGYWLTLVGAGRAIMLAIVLPLVYKFFKPPPTIIEVPRPASSLNPEGEEEPLLSPRTPKRPWNQHSQSQANDAEEGIAATLNRLRADDIPSIPNHRHRSTRLHGRPRLSPNDVHRIRTPKCAWCRVQPGDADPCAGDVCEERGDGDWEAVWGVECCSGVEILGPAVYGFVYIKTVVVFPRAIFVVGLLAGVASLFLVSLVRVPRESELRKEVMGGDIEEDSVLEDGSEAQFRVGARVDVAAGPPPGR